MMMSIRKKLPIGDKLMFALYIIIILNIILVIIALVVMFQVNYYLRPALQFAQAPLPTDKPAYRPGEVVKVFTQSCQYADQPEQVLVQIVTGATIPLIQKPRPDPPPGCYEILTPVARIPEDYQSQQPVYLRGKVQVSLNRLTKRVEEWESTPFRVVEE